MRRREFVTLSAARQPWRSRRARSLIACGGSGADGGVARATQSTSLARGVPGGPQKLGWMESRNIQTDTAGERRRGVTATMRRTRRAAA